MPAPVTSIKAGKLTTQQANPRVGSIISPHRESVVDTLSPQALGAIMREADEGNGEAYLTLAEEMEEREPHYASVGFTRKLAVSGIRPVVESPKDAVDMKILEDVEDNLIRVPAFEGLVLDLMDGVFKGFSCVEIIWDKSESQWLPKRYEFRPQRFFVFDRDTMTIPHLRTDQDATYGEPLDPFKWLTHIPKVRSGVPLRTGIARTVAVCYAAKRWTVADWMAFLDIYGIPIRLGKYPASMSDKKGALLKAVRQIGSDAAAVIPSEMTVEIIESTGGASGSGITLFQQGAEYWDKQTSKVVLGQTMTTDDGSSLAQASVHENTRFDIRDADSRAICATIDRDLIKPYVDLNYGPQKVYPMCCIRQRKTEQMLPLMQATQIYVNLGGKVQASEAGDKLGWSEPEEGAELLQPAAKVTPPPAPTLPLPPPKAPGEPDKGASSNDGPAGDGDKVEGDGKNADLNSMPRERTFDETDVQTDAELEHWRELESSNVGRLLAAIQNAASYGEARALLEELQQDEGDVLDVGALVVSLARSTYKLRGIGDATDDVKP